MTNDQGIKKTVEELVTSLQKQGIKVDGAAILKLDSNSPEQDKIIDQTVDNIMNKLGLPRKTHSIKKEEVDQVTGEELPINADGTTVGCTCPNCFNFETFEQQLAPKGGQFDYTTVTLGGKEFNIKYYYDGKGDERMMISPKEFTAPQGATLEQLQDYLNSAVQAKEFDKAQVYLDAINKLKNQ